MLSLNEKQKEFFDKAMMGENLFITGAAGTGKTFLVNAIVDEFEKKGKRVIKVAPTGVAARSIGGYTIHHQFHVDVKEHKVQEKYEKKNDWIKTTDLIVIDEISMVSFLLFNTISRQIVKNNFKGQIIVIGDFYQLSPVFSETEEIIAKRRGYVIDGNKSHCFHSEYWKRFGFKTCQLTQAMRQEDQAFSTALFNLSRGTLTSEDRAYLKRAQENKRMDDAINLSCINKTVDKINKEELDKLEGKPVAFTAKTWRSYDTDIPKELILKVGAKVMMTNNDPDNRFCNGDIGFITEIGKGTITVKLEDDEVEVEPFKFSSFAFEDGKVVMKGYIEQLPVKLAWAISVHKSQGQTFDKVNFLYNKGWFNGSHPSNLTLLYVGMSRARNIENLYLDIKSSLPEFTNQDIKDFYEKNEYETYYSSHIKRDTGVGF